MHGLTHILGKAKLLIPAFKVRGITDLVAVFRNIEDYARVGNFQRNNQGTFPDEAMQFIVSTYWFFCFENPSSVDGSNDFPHDNDSRII